MGVMPATNIFQSRMVSVFADMGVPYIDNILISAEKFDQVWLCSKPRPQIIVHNNGTEFTGAEFQEMLSSYDIEAEQTTVKNPTANSLIKQIHSPLEDQLRTIFLATITLVKSITFFRLLFLQSGQPRLPIAHTQLLYLHTKWT